MNRRDVYMNPIQQKIFFAGARDIRLLGARRLGKTDGTIGPQVWRVAQSMPQMTGCWLGNSRSQLYSRTVPGTIAAIERFYGLKEGVHFGWGRPPKWVPKSIMKPKDYSNIIWFANGSIFALVSLAVSGSANSYTFNYLFADECKFMSKAKIDGEVMPALSGITHPLGDQRFSEWNPWYKGTLFCSDASLTTKGNWLEHEEEKLDLECEQGRFKGKTNRELQSELDHYATRIMYFNELLRSAKMTKHNVIVCDKLKRRLIRAMAEKVMAHEGQFKILPNYGKHINEATIKMLLNYHLLEEDDAELLYNHEYLITEDEHMELIKLKQSKKYSDYIRELRCSTFAFYRASTLDNIDILGEDYIARMKRDLPPLVFAISILNMKTLKSNDGFYSNLDIENVHGYDPEDCPAIDKSFKLKTASTVQGGTRINTEYETPDFSELQNLKNCTLDGDVVNDQELFIAFDYNANINWVVTGQVYRRDGLECLNVLSSMYVKNERKLKQLCADWNRYYSPKRAAANGSRTVTYFYDSTSKFRSYAVEGIDDFKDTIIKELTRYGWDVHGVDMGVPMRHEEKYHVINEALAGLTSPAIRINRVNNEALIIAMQATGVTRGYNGFHKDKSGEKLSEEAEDAVRLEYRTDGTDAFDSLYLGVKSYRNNFGFMCLPSGH